MTKGRELIVSLRGELDHHAARETVTAIERNHDNTYKVYQVFKADIDTGDKASHIAWSAAAKTPVRR